MPVKNSKVAIVGAGIAGLTAALRLSERGFDVTIYEAQKVVGGNLSASRADGKGPYHDVYPHMFCSWYHNLWSIIEHDLGFKREELFEPRTSVKLLRKGSSRYLELTNASTLQGAWQNLRSGVVPFADMVVWGFSMLDLVSQPFHPEQLLSRYSVNGFLHSRPYTTERSAELHDLFLMEVWSVHGDLTSASSYKDFIKYSLTFPQPAPFAWLLKSNLYEGLIRPFEEKLKEDPNPCSIKTEHEVISVGINEPNGPIRLKVMAADEKAKAEDVDYVVLAVPPKALSNLVQASVGKKGKRIVDMLPQLSELRRLRAEPIPVLNLYFKKKLADIPREHVGLSGSGYDLTFLDLSQLWTDDPYVKDVTALTLAASDYYMIPSETGHEQAHLLIKRLHEYLPVFNPGERWGDPESDIDWDISHFQTNENHKLFINQVGSEQWYPPAHYEELPGVFFAGDFCKSPLEIATVEAAVMSGLLAAKALCLAEGRKGAPVAPVEVILPETHSDRTILAAKLAAAPYAYAAKWMSTAAQTFPRLASGETGPKLTENIADMYSLPQAFAVEWWRTAGMLWQDVFLKR